MKKVLFLSPYPFGTAGSQRFRYEQYLDILNQSGFEHDHQSFLDQSTWDILYQEGQSFKKVLGLIRGFLRRFILMFRLAQYDFVFIHREVTPIGPPLFEWIICKVWKKKTIYDFDDAIWQQNTSKSNSIASLIKFPQKVGMICQWSHRVSAGNKYLADYAKTFNSKVTINPTTIDTENLHYPKPYTNSKTVIGWTGTHSTLKYLDLLKPTLKELVKSHGITVKIIADQPPTNFITTYDFVSWNKKSEIEDLNTIDIGLMPLSDDKWSKGKCGFKALQYMALETPVVASPVGVNTEIIEEQESGYLCDSQDNWKEKLTVLIENTELRKSMGKAGRSRVKKRYSVLSNTNNFIELFQ